MCAHHALTQLVPSFSELDVTVSTASGGTLGYLLHQSTLATDDPAPERSANAKLVEYPPPLAANLTLEQMKSHAVAKGHTWWANAVKLGSEMGAEMGAGTADMLMSRSSAVRKRLGNLEKVSIEYIEASGDWLRRITALKMPIPLCSTMQAAGSP